MPRAKTAAPMKSGKQFTETEVPLSHPLNKELIALRVQQAMEGDAASIAECLAHYRESNECGEQADHKLIDWMRWELDRCVRASNPLRAVETLLATGARKRGRPKTPERDFKIAVAVHSHVEEGMDITKACEAVRDELIADKSGELTVKQIGRLYRRALKEVGPKLLRPV